MYVHLVKCSKIRIISNCKKRSLRRSILHVNNREELSEKNNPKKKEKVCNRNIKDILQLNLFCCFTTSSPKGAL